MRITIRGQECRAGVTHNVYAHTGLSDQPRRGTRAWFSTPNREIGAVALCHPNDQYNRRIGRTIACVKLNERLKEEGYTRPERQEIINAIQRRGQT
jgi:hypothetical protein